MMFWFVLSLQSLIAVIFSELRILGFGCPQLRLRNSTPGALGMAMYYMLGKDPAASGRASWSILAMNPVCFVFVQG